MIEMNVGGRMMRPRMNPCQLYQFHFTESQINVRLSVLPYASFLLRELSAVCINAFRWTAVPRSRPHPTQDLFQLYGLEPLANSVRRKDPVTGEKINKLRKSYESKIKEFAGKNKPVVNEGEFFHLLNWPDEEWANTRNDG